MHWCRRRSGDGIFIDGNLNLNGNMEDVQYTRFSRSYKLNVITVFSVGHLFHGVVIILQVNF